MKEKRTRWYLFSILLVANLLLMVAPALAMSASTVTVTLNALLLNRIRFAEDVQRPIPPAQKLQFAASRI